MNTFPSMAGQDAAPLKNGGDVDRYLSPELKSRKVDLKKRMCGLNEIQPVLTGRYLVKGWLDRGAASVVYGESNVGKTFFALDIALHVAAGLPWHGNKVALMLGANRLGPVVYVAAEGGVGINNRIEAIRHDNPDLLKESNFTLLPTGLDLCGATDGEALVTAIKEKMDHAVLIVIDTLARTMGNGDENTARDMGAFVRNMDLLRERTGAHVMVIHHSGKDVSKGARGSGSLRAAVDTEIELRRSGNVIMAETRKQRDFSSGKVFAYSLRSVIIGHDEDGDLVTSAVVQDAVAVKKLPTLSKQQKIALEAFNDALDNYGVTKTGEAFPSDRICVPLEDWRECCERHALTVGLSDSAYRQAFGRACKVLQEKEIVRVFDGFVWMC